MFFIESGWFQRARRHKLASLTGTTSSMLTALWIAASAVSFDAVAHNEWKHAQCGGKAMGAKYVNYAQGFSVSAPPPYVFRRFVDSGPEHGAPFALSSDCDAVVVVYGEANALEWADLTAAVEWESAIARERDPSTLIETSRTRLGPLPAIAIQIQHPGTGDIDRIVHAFRPGGGPVYTAHLATTTARYQKDLKAFNATLRSFRLERWD